MDRKDYWNKEYALYFKKIIDEAESKDGTQSKVEKLSGHDFKSPGIKTITSFLDQIIYKPEDKLLDYGCGLGRFYPYFSDKCDYYGIDISQAMIDECIKTFPEKREKFIVAEGEDLPFEDAFFNQVICYGVFDACFQEPALAEMLRVCKKGGVLVISGKNDNYYPDDEEAYIAEINARKKGHPNYFTNVPSMLGQVCNYCEIIHERYALRRGDSGKNIFTDSMPGCFYEWMVILKKKVDNEVSFVKFSDEYSKTWKMKNK